MTDAPPLQKLTTDEAIGLGSRHNLADAHTHQTPSWSEHERIFARIDGMLEEARARRGRALDVEGFAAFLSASGQKSVAKDEWFIATYASSISIEIVANVLCRLGKSVGLTEPTFDCIADILKRNRLIVSPIRLEGASGYHDAVTRFLQEDRMPSDVIFLVVPNNPTGHALTETEFDSIVRRCAECSSTLMLDTSFRPFDERFMFDQYAIMHKHRVNYIVVEDTGKLWPTLDIKASYIMASECFRGLIEEIASDLLLNISPFASVLVREYSKFSAADHFHSVRNVVSTNRRFLRAEFASMSDMVEFPYQDSCVSAELLRIRSSTDATWLAARLLDRGIAVLSGRAFFWQTASSRDQFLRVALARDAGPFRDAVTALKLEMMLLLGEERIEECGG